MTQSMPVIFRLSLKGSIYIYIVTGSHRKLIVPEHRPEIENDYSKQLIAKWISPKGNINGTETQRGRIILCSDAEWGRTYGRDETLDLVIIVLWDTFSRGLGGR